MFGLVLDRTLKDTITGLCRYITNRSSKTTSASNVSVLTLTVCVVVTSVVNIGGLLELETFHTLAFQLLKAFSLKSE